MKSRIFWLTLPLTAVLLAVGLYMFRGPLLTPVFRRAAVSAIHAQTGLIVALGGLESDGFSYLQLTDLRTLRPNPAGPVKSLNIRILRVDFSLLDLVSGWRTLIARSRVRLQGAHADIDLTHPGPAPRAAAPGSGGAFVLPGLPQLSVQDSSLAVKTRALEIERLDLSAAGPPGGPVALQLKSALVSWLSPDGRSRSGALDLQARYSPVALSLDRLDLGGESILEKCRVRFTGATTAFETAWRVLGGRVEANGTLETGRLSLKADLKSVRIERIVDLIELGLPKVSGSVTARIDGVINLISPTNSQGQFKLKLTQGSLRGVPVSRLDIDAIVGKGVLTLTRVSAEFNGNKLAVRDGTIPLAGLKTQDLAGHFEISLDDFPSAARLVGLAWPKELPKPRVQAQGVIDRGLVRLVQADIQTGPARQTSLWLRLQNTQAPLDALVAGDLRGLAAESTAVFQADIEDVPSVLAWLGMPESAVSNYPHRLVFSGEAGQGKLSIPSGRMEMDTGTLVLENALVTWPGASQAWNDTAISAQARLAAENVKPLSVLLHLPPISGALNLSLALSGTLAVPALDWSLSARQLSLSQPENVRLRLETAQGQGTLRGTVSAPVLTGTLSVKNFDLSLGPPFPPLRLGALMLSLQGSEARVVEGRGTIGGSPFTIGGHAVLSNGAPVLDLNLQGNNLLLARDENLRVRADTRLAVTGPLESLLISGSLMITDGLFSQPVDYLGLLRGPGRPAGSQDLQWFSFPDPPWSQLHFQITVGAKEPFQIRNTMASGSVRPSLTLEGSGEVPVLAGKIYLDPSSIQTPSGVLQITSGVLTFAPSASGLVQLNLSANTQALGYAVTLQISGTAENPILTWASIPPLSDQECMLLVLSGTPPRTQSGGGLSRQTGVNVAVYLGRGLVSQWLGGGRGRSVLDRLQVELGRDVNLQGAETIDAQFLLAQDLLRRDDSLYLTSQRDLFDNYNAGVKLEFDFK